MDAEMVDYKGCRIKAEPLQRKGDGQWTTRFLLIYSVGNEKFDDLYDQEPETFATREEAVQHSLNVARQIIDGSL
jgi:hypothetical protein